MGRLDLWGVPCIYTQEKDVILAYPKNEEDRKLLIHHQFCKEFEIEYSELGGFKNKAFIERISLSSDGAYALKVKYCAKRCCSNSFNGMELTGDVIDDFFSPATYYYFKSKEEKNMPADLIYNHEIADRWNIKFEGNPIIVSLSYGDILHRGIASDLKLHPKLEVAFEKTEDIQYVYRVYQVIIRFFQIIRYKLQTGPLKVELFSLGNNGEKAYNGAFDDYEWRGKMPAFVAPAQNYHWYKPYMQRLLQFVASHPVISMNHYPKQEERYSAADYSALDIMSIFQGFESECHADKDLYEKTSTEEIESIKKRILKAIDEINEESLNDREKQFIGEIKDKVYQQGTQFGMTRKVQNAYSILKEALDDSVDHIMYKCGLEQTRGLTEKEIRKTSKQLVAIRSAVVHGDSLDDFSEEDAQQFRFLEALSYAQMLKRAGLSDEEIRGVVAAVFTFDDSVLKENAEASAPNSVNRS